MLKTKKGIMDLDIKDEMPKIAHIGDSKNGMTLRMGGEKMKSTKELILEIIEITAYVDDESHVWGKDTDLGTIKEVQSEIKEKINYLIISPIVIEKDIARMISAANEKAFKAETKLKIHQNNRMEQALRNDLENHKKMITLKTNFNNLGKEYNKLLRAWYKLKYSKELSQSRLKDKEGK